MTELLYSALHSPLGIVVETNNVDLLRQRLYTLRRSDPLFAPLSLVPSPINSGELWIVNREITIS